MKKPLSAPDTSREAKLKAFDRLLTVMNELRENCPWDKKQTLETLRHLTIEETYELADAILDGPRSRVVDEAENRYHVQRALLHQLIGQKS